MYPRTPQVLFFTGDPVTNTRVGERFVERTPGALALENVDGAGHLLQEGKGTEVGDWYAAFLRSSG